MKKIFIAILTLGVFVANAQETTKTKEKTVKEVKVKEVKAKEPKKESVSTSSSEELTFTSKNGHEVLPQTGDWGFGISATAPLTYLGGLLGAGSAGAGIFAPSNQAANVTSAGTTVFGKYMVSSTFAYRAHLSTFTGRTTTLSGLIADDGDANKFVQDKQNTIARGLVLSAGIEKRRGYGRLIGIYGVEALIGFNQGNITKYQYANQLSAANQAPTDGFGGNNNEIAVAGVTNNRTLSKKSSSTYGLGAQLFGGVEYFVAPRLSLGGEFNWGIYYKPSTSTATNVEFYNGTTNAVEEYTRKTEGGSVFQSGTSTLSGNANMIFYF